MEEQHYKNIFNYLTMDQTPTSFIQSQTKQLIKQSKNYIVKNNLLYKKSKNQPTKYFRVIQKEELPALLYMMHNDPTSGHFALESTFNKIKERYYWPQYY